MPDHLTVLNDDPRQRIDQLALPAVRSPAERRAWLAVTVPGSRPVAYAAVAARCLADPPGTRSRMARWRPLIVLAGGDVARTALCHVIGRPRPPAAERLAPTHGPSFPSRHTATAVLAVRLAGGSTRVAGWAAAAVGVSRIALRVHWPSDVVGGWLFGHGWLALVDLTRHEPGAPGPRRKGVRRRRRQRG